MAGLAGFEPATGGFRVHASTPELQARCDKYLYVFATKVNPLMRLLDLIEAPIGDFATIGDFSVPSSIPDASDRRAVTAPPMVKRIMTAWEKTPFTFNMFFANVPGAEKYVETGYVDSRTVKAEFPEMASRILAGKTMAAPKPITVVFTNNIGDEGISFTPWIMAHRISHALILPNNKSDTRQGVQNTAFSAANEAVIALSVRFKSECELLLKTSMRGIPVGMYARPFYEHIGTMKSARAGKLTRPYEFSHEVFAQYLLTGGVRFNPLTVEFMNKFATTIAGATPLNPADENRMESLDYFNRKLEKAAAELPAQFQKGLVSAQGKVIFI